MTASAACFLHLAEFDMRLLVLYPEDTLGNWGGVGFVIIA